MMSQEFQASLLKETPCVVTQTKPPENGFKSLARKALSRKSSGHSFENEFTSVWSTTPPSVTPNERCDALTSSRRSSNVASSILMRRAPSIVFEDVGGSVGIERYTWGPSPTSPQMSSRPSVAVDANRVVAESTLNSLECWDYSVELECLSGPDGKGDVHHEIVDKVDDGKHRWPIITLTFKDLSTSVNRWLDYFPLFGYLQQLKFAQNL